MRKLNKIIIALMSVMLNGCSATDDKPEALIQTGRIDQMFMSKHGKPRSNTEEYVGRIAKRVLLVSDHPDLNYSFRVASDSTAELQYDIEQRSITLSRGLLQELDDEAELAAVLCLAMNTVDHIGHVDQATINNLFRAGYDPQALLDLQARYHLANMEDQEHWLDVIYASPIDNETFQSNEEQVAKLAHGLERGRQAYQKQIKGDL